MTRSERTTRPDGGTWRGHRVAAPVAAAGAVVAATSLLLDWHRSGEVARSGVALARSVERLGLVEAAWARAAVELGRALPVLAALVVAAAVTGRQRLAGGLAVVAGAAAVGLAAAVWWEVPGSVATGPAVAATGGAVALVAGAACVRRSGEGPFSGPGGGSS